MNHKLAQLQTVSKPIDRLIPHPKNANTHPDSQIEKLRHLIKVHGYAKGSVVYQKSTGYLLAGHGIIEALKAEGYTHVDAVELDVDDDKALAFLVADNKIASDSIIDDISLQKAINELSEMDVPALDFGFDDVDLSELADRILEWHPEAVDMPELPDGDRQPFQQMTFVMSDDQAETVKEALKIAKDNGDFADTINENSNGNALARIAEAYIG